MGSVDREMPSEGPEAPVDRFPISLRAYTVRKPKGDQKVSKGRPKSFRPVRIKPSDWVLVFDTETRTTPDQELRFGAYQLRFRGALFERGVFYGATLGADELRTLTNAAQNDLPTETAGPIRILSREEFVRDVFFEKAYKTGAQIVGLNLPFDLSRLAIDHAPARRNMKGGFSFTMLEGKEWPHVRVKHLSPRSSLINFAGTKSERNVSDDDEDEDQERDPDRGYFVDLKTAAAALTSQSHSLASLSKLLNVATVKEPSEEHGEKLTSEYVHYGMRDVQTTWECFEALSNKLSALSLEDTGLYDLYSEASLGKAYLKTMGVKPWREVQPKFPDKITGHIMSAYFGGRSEVHIRRQITPVIHCDFLSMYPTICTLMGLWEFVRLTGVTYEDDTENVREFVEACEPNLLRQQAAWRDLTVLVQVIAQGDLFPVRAHYGDDGPATIGLNCLTSHEPMWFTLADVLVSKILTGMSPKILRAIRFRAAALQRNLKSISIAGKQIDPTTDDFYRSLIEHRKHIQEEIKIAPDENKGRLESDQLGVKILANATSYGIFVELIVKEYAKKEQMVAYGVRDRPFTFEARKYEDPGRYFHPLLATLITGGARLMLALAERQVRDQSLDWAFCDTDSIAIANPDGLPLKEYESRALAVRDWFVDLNPYSFEGSILQLEKVNFPAGKAGDLDALNPPNCLAVSAKRYVLFNDQDGKPIIRKASGHGLGHLLEPYDEEPKLRRERIRRIGVPLWQEDLWRKIIEAAQSDKPDVVITDDLRNFDMPAASRYAATTPELLKWFKDYNNDKPYSEQVRPFNFLLSFQAKSRMEMAADDPDALKHPLWNRREPRPAAPYTKDIAAAAEQAFDRERPDESIPPGWLKSLARSLARYHLHQESKFWGGEYDQCGTLHRRHVHALAFQLIGKEADNIEEKEFIGDDEGPIEHPLETSEQKALIKFISETQKEVGFSDRALCRKAKVSHHTLAALREGKDVSSVSVSRLIRGTRALLTNVDRY